MWYLMSARSLFNSTQVGIDRILNEWDEGTIYVVRTADGKKKFAVTAASTFGKPVYELNEVVRWTQDTGLGHKRPSDDRLWICNIIEFGKCVATNKTTIKFKLTQVGIGEKHPCWVFK